MYNAKMSTFTVTNLQELILTKPQKNQKRITENMPWNTKGGYDNRNFITHLLNTIKRGLPLEILLNNLLI